jgi:hypothetical protein
MNTPERFKNQKEVAKAHFNIAQAHFIEAKEIAQKEGFLLHPKSKFRNPKNVANDLMFRALENIKSAEELGIAEDEELRRFKQEVENFIDKLNKNEE